MDVRRGEFLLGRREVVEQRGDVEAPRTVTVDRSPELPTPRADAEATL
jgi:hypothetical protein